MGLHLIRRTELCAQEGALAVCKRGGQGAACLRDPLVGSGLWPSQLPLLCLLMTGMMLLLLWPLPVQCLLMIQALMLWSSMIGMPLTRKIAIVTAGW